MVRQEHYSIPESALPSGVMASREDSKVGLAKQFLWQALPHHLIEDNHVVSGSLSPEEALEYARTLALVSIAESLHEISEHGLNMRSW